MSGAFSGATAVPSGSTRARLPVCRKAVVLRCFLKFASAARASRSSVRTSASVGAPGLGASARGSPFGAPWDPAPWSSTTCARERAAAGVLLGKPLARRSRALGGEHDLARGGSAAEPPSSAGCEELRPQPARTAARAIRATR